jgi:dihydrofolate reductase
VICIVAAVAKNWVIGEKGRLPWSFPTDLERFKKLTLGHTVVFGRKTYEFLEHELKGRNIIILTKDKDYNKKHAISCMSVEDILHNYLTSNALCFIAGGESIYSQFMDYGEKIFLTVIEKDFAGDAFFPVEKMRKFEIVSSEERTENSVLLRFLVYKQKLPAHKVG